MGTTSARNNTATNTNVNELHDVLNEWVTFGEGRLGWRGRRRRADPAADRALGSPRDPVVAEGLDVFAMEASNSFCFA